MTGLPPLPADLRAMLEAVRRVGRPRLVGGGVRDWLLGIAAKDFDIEVAQTDFETLHRALAPFGSTDVVGRSFGVLKVRSAATQTEYDFSLPRRESKTGSGHRGFAVAPDPTLSDAEAAARRDFTVNAIALDPFTGQLIDPHGGQRDLAARVLRHTSPAFVEDPLRVLRGLQLAARFDFTLATETAALSRAIRATCRELPVERIWGEWWKWAEKSRRPSRGLDVLEQTGWLEHFPEIAALRGTPQEPEWHPEGDVFDHTRHCLDALAADAAWSALPEGRRGRLMLATLAHDFGKPATTARQERRGVMRWTSNGHEPAGGPIAAAFLRRIGAPLDLDAPVAAIVVHHLAHHHGQGPGFSAAHIRRLARKLAPATIADLALVMTADANGRPPLASPETHARIAQLCEDARRLALADAAPKPILLGRHLIQLGLKPGPAFTPLLEAAFEAQLDGTFGDETGALAWAQTRLQPTSNGQHS
jgi:tRNA nucleotidyltransferase (CCA-adding enzyme)